MLAKIGVSYKIAPLATLDAITLRDLPPFYKILRSIPGIKGTVVVQTCNRVDMFIDANDGAEIIEKILWNWALQTKFKLHELKRIAEQRTGEQVLEYLVSLASGLESMLVGESQILGQLKSSLIEARGLAASSPILCKVFDMSIAAGTRIRDRTGIGRGTVSLGSAALKVAEASLGNLNAVKVLLLGTGQIGMVLMKALKARGINEVTVASRTRQRTESFCRTFGGIPADFKNVISQLGPFGLVVVATRAAGYLLTKEIVLPQLKSDRNPKLMILDLSIPRNVSPDLGQLKDVVIKTIDDLRDITDQAVSVRKTLVKEAEPKVLEAVEKISALLRREEAEPMVSELYHRADKIRREELEKALSKLNLPKDQREVLERMSLSLVRKLLAQPVVNLREAAKKGDSKLLTVAGEIFEGE
ncbi:MAG: glutamyl-tRNA reductase [Crenarchaeota archaeon 13_1_40CM_3_52_10]|nr:MAG: glutamyl-tRNA reductase [Crenarchaeota archaeon 13_1_40CM_3_52_10]